jgi:DNA invertase Pin-like site-specific DNA recombinase
VVRPEHESFRDFLKLPGWGRSPIIAGRRGPHSSLALTRAAQGHLRTSSATNVGEGKDSEARQRKAIESFAKAAGYIIVDWFYDAAVSGADPIETRAGFTAALARIAGNGVRTIVVETANRFARDLMVQEVGFAMLRDLGVTLIAADSPSSFLDDGPTSKLIRQIANGASARAASPMRSARAGGS